MVSTLWCIVPNVLEQLNITEFDVDANKRTCGAISKFWTDSLTEDWTNLNVFAVPAYDKVSENLIRFVRFSIHNPEKTKATFLIPDWKEAEWYPIVNKYFNIISTLPRGSYSTTGNYLNWDLLYIKSKDHMQISEKGIINAMTKIQSKSVLDAFPEYNGPPSEVMPNNLKEAAKLPDARAMFLAYFHEIDTLIRLKFGQVVDRPANRKIVGSRLVFRVKYNDGIYERHKCRFVVKGYSQIFGIDYLLTYSPVISLQSIRLMLTICLNKGLKLFHLDVEAAFPNVDLKEEIYIELPEGHAEFSPNGVPKVLKLLKSLYGLKQAGLNWHDYLAVILLEFGFVRSEVDTCLYIYDKDGEYCIIGVYVDDIPGGSSSQGFIERLVAFISKKVKVSTSDLTQLLGFQIHATENYIELSMNHYIKKILKDYNLLTCKEQAVPLLESFEISYQGCPTDVLTKLDLAKKPFANLIGILWWISSTTRPDITCAVGILSRFTSNYGYRHYNALLGVLKYLKGTPNVTFRLNKVSTPIRDKIICYCDSDYAGDKILSVDGDKTMRHSTTGYLIYFMGSLISWGTSKQDYIAQSSTEAEYVALNTCGKEFMFLKQLLESIGFPDVSGTIFEDNTGAIDISKNPVCSSNTKHFEVRFHYIRYLVHRWLNITHISTREQLADAWTKPLGPKIFLYLMSKIMHYS